jgi:hypothetical protein
MRRWTRWWPRLGRLAGRNGTCKRCVCVGHRTCGRPATMPSSRCRWVGEGRGLPKAARAASRCLLRRADQELGDGDVAGAAFDRLQQVWQGGVRLRNIEPNCLRATRRASGDQHGVAHGACDGKVASLHSGAYAPPFLLSSASLSARGTCGIDLAAACPGVSDAWKIRPPVRR